MTKFCEGISGFLLCRCRNLQAAWGRSTKVSVAVGARSEDLEKTKVGNLGH